MPIMRKGLTHIAIDWRGIGLILLSGLLLTLIFPSFNLEILAWIAFIPLFAALQGQSLKNAFWIGWGTGVVHFVGTLYWVTVAMEVYGGLPKGVSFGLLVVLVVYLSLYFGAFSMLLRYLEIRTCIPLIVGAPVAWAALEYVRTYFFIGFPWNLLGYSQHLAPVVIQIADITGVYGLSFLVMLANAGIYTSLFSTASSKTKITAAVVTAGCIGACVVYGMLTLSAAKQTAETTETVRVAVIQGNIDQGI
jgi:apolipoprotein N-acyltransferase